MDVSIIIPCFRQGRYLGAAIESCLAQTCKGIEVIVVNDGSDDDTDDVARSYGDSIRYLRKSNGGVSVARNAGIAAASGRYLKFLDADDHIVPEQVEWQMAAMDGRSDVVSVTGLRAYEDGRPEKHTDILPNFRLLMPDMLNQPDGSPHAFLFPASLVSRINGWDPRYPITQDFNFYCRIGRLRPTMHCDARIGGFYRLRAGSLSTNKAAFAMEVATQLIRLHDDLRNGPDAVWFGPELLGAEQRAYRSMLLRSCGDAAIRRELLVRIEELRHSARPPRAQPKFEALCRTVGYAAAEQLYVRYLKWVRRRSHAPVIPINRVSGN